MNSLNNSEEETCSLRREVDRLIGLLKEAEQEAHASKKEGSQLQNLCKFANNTLKGRLMSTDQTNDKHKEFMDTLILVNLFKHFVVIVIYKFKSYMPMDLVGEFNKDGVSCSVPLQVIIKARGSGLHNGKNHDNGKNMISRIVVCDGSYKTDAKIVQVDETNEEKYLYFIETQTINNSNRSKRRHVGQYHDLTMVDKEARLLPESNNQRAGISFEDYDICHVNFLHHDALVIILKMRNIVLHTMMVDTGSSIELIFQSTIDQMGLADKVEPSNINVSGFNGSMEERVGKITLPITAGPVTLDVVFYIIKAKSHYLDIMGRPWLHNMKAIPSAYHQTLRFDWKPEIGSSLR
ncbi:hypothetical protein GIB67_037398 [Kingdonia uniflora]|uniref:Peptidase A2 domain-containing protein n=1 Tax=Kingdonia uniflora TaxID=39325 RepID=A0A7J7M8T1_9MAGN|nr:hypothetical protein GIB67_037398 [Kingdonia uniflora]